MSTPDVKSKPTRVYLFTQLRTGSHLFMKLVCSYPGAERMDYPYMLAHTVGPEATVVEDYNKWMQLPEDVVKNAFFQPAFDSVKDFIVQTEKKGNYPIVKDALGCHGVLKPDEAHPDRPIIKTPQIVDKDCPDQTKSVFSTNGPSAIFLPDSFLASITPVILIRHPGRTIPSLARAFGRAGDLKPGDISFELYASYYMARILFDHLNTYYHKKPRDADPENSAMAWPIVIDGDDLITEPELIMGKFCNAVGWDVKLIQFTWEPHVSPAAAIVQNQQIADPFFETIQNSTGINRPEKPLVEPDLDVELNKWINEFGEEKARIMHRIAKKSMDDYNYLRQYRL